MFNELSNMAILVPAICISLSDHYPIMTHSHTNVLDTVYKGVTQLVVSVYSRFPLYAHDSSWEMRRTSLVHQSRHRDHCARPKTLKTPRKKTCKQKLSIPSNWAL